MADERFVDAGTVLADFADLVLVVCPSCDGCASIVPWPPPEAVAAGRNLFHSRRRVCASCGDTDDWSGCTVSVGRGADPWFGNDLWLRTSTAGRTLWAWNERHLDVLDAFVSARLRDRPRETAVTSTLVEHLPDWIKADTNRDAVRAGIRRLRARLAAHS